jgi:hypothetical protein
MNAPMTRTAKWSLSAAGLAAVAFGGALWAQFGSMVYFDQLAAGLVGCFF